MEVRDPDLQSHPMKILERHKLFAHQVSFYDICLLVFALLLCVGMS